MVRSEMQVITCCDNSMISLICSGCFHHSTLHFYALGALWSLVVEREEERELSWNTNICQRWLEAKRKKEGK